MSEARVLIAGAGPVGLVAAAHLVRQGVPVTVLEAEPGLNAESRASTFHPPTLDMLDELGAARALIEQGLVAPILQYRSRAGLIAQFDFGAIADLTRHPFRLQAEQFKLTRILERQLRSEPLFGIEFGKRVAGATQDVAGVTVSIEGGESRRGAWLVGADGASSRVRQSQAIAFEGFTWPERFLVISTPYDFQARLPDLAAVSYVADPERWHFLLRIPGLWRVMFPTAPEMTDEAATSEAFVRRMLASIVPEAERAEIVHVTLYRVHQRVAGTFRAGRVLLAGDAAHINNPLGGMGMNGGIHDAVNLAGRLADVWHGRVSEAALDRYDRERRGVTLEVVQRQTTENKRNLEARDEASQARFRDTMRATASDPGLARDHLIRISMIASLRRAAELG